MRLLRGLFLVIFVLTLSLGVVIRVWSIQQTDTTSTSGHPFDDDAYLYFTLARNIADGNGPRVDEVHMTTGFQFLWGMLAVIPYLVLPASATIIGVQFLGVLVGLLTFAVIYLFTRQVTRSSVAGLINAGLWFLSPWSVWENINGMETGLATFALIFLLWCFYNVYQQGTRRWLIGYGLMCGIAAIARSDAAILSACTLLFLSIFPPQKSKRLGTIIPVVVFAILPVLPWLLFTASLGKSPVSESGAAMQVLSYYFYDQGPRESLSEQITYTLKMLSWFWFFFLRESYALVPLTLGRSVIQEYLWIGYLAIALFAFIRREVLWRVIAVYTPAVVLVFFAYAYVIPATWYYFRYAQPWSETASVLIVIIGLTFILSLRIRSRLFIVALSVASLIYGLLLFRYTEFKNYFSYDTMIVTPASQDDIDPLYLATQWLNDNATQTERVGTFQTGLASYYSQIPLINLDGVVNIEASQALLNKQLWQYICSQRIDYLSDWTEGLNLMFDRTMSRELVENGFTKLVEFPAHSSRHLSASVYRVNTELCEQP